MRLSLRTNHLDAVASTRLRVLLASSILFNFQGPVCLALRSVCAVSLWRLVIISHPHRSVNPFFHLF